MYVSSLIKLFHFWCSFMVCIDYIVFLFFLYPLCIAIGDPAKGSKSAQIKQRIVQGTIHEAREKRRGLLHPPAHSLWLYHSCVDNFCSSCKFPATTPPESIKLVKEGFPAASYSPCASSASPMVRSWTCPTILLVPELLQWWLVSRSPFVWVWWSEPCEGEVPTVSLIDTYKTLHNKTGSLSQG